MWMDKLPPEARARVDEMQRARRELVEMAIYQGGDLVMARLLVNCLTAEIKRIAEKEGCA